MHDGRKDAPRRQAKQQIRVIRTVSRTVTEDATREIAVRIPLQRKITAITASDTVSIPPIAKSQKSRMTRAAPAAAKLVIRLRDASSNRRMMNVIQRIRTGEGKDESRIPSRGRRRPTDSRSDSRA